MLELRAVRLGLLHFTGILQGKTIVMCSDNATTLAYLTKEGGTRSTALNTEAQNTLRWGEEHSKIPTQFVKASSNVLTDCLSRHNQIISTEWSLHQEVCTRLEAMGLSISGSLRYEAQLEATKLCFAFPRPQSDCDGRFLIQLEPSGAVRHPSLSSGQECAKQSTYCSGHHTYPDSSLLAQEGMVSRPHTGDSKHALTPPTSQGFTT